MKMTQVDESIEKIEKFKESFRKSLEKSLSDFKKNVTDLLNSHDKSKQKLKLTFEKSLDSLIKSNRNIHDKELMNLEAFDKQLTENFTDYISQSFSELVDLKNSFISKLSNFNVNLKGIATSKVEMVNQTYENVLDSIQKTFQQYLSEFLDNVETSRKALMDALDHLESETFEKVSEHFQELNDVYNENKDILNNFIMLIFNEIKSTTGASFQVLQEQIKFLHGNAITQLDLNNKSFEEYFEKIQSEYENEVTTFSESISDYFEKFKAKKEEYEHLLIEQITTNIEVHEMETISKIVEVMKIFASKSNEQFKKLNLVIRENLEKAISEFDGELAEFNQKARDFFAQFLTTQEVNVKNIKKMVEDRLNEMVTNQDKVVDEFKETYLNALALQVKGYTQETEKYLKTTADLLQAHKTELGNIDKENQRVLQGLMDLFSASEEKLKKIHETGTFNISTDADFKKVVKTVLNTISKIRDESETLRMQLDVNNQRATKLAAKNNNTMVNILIKNNKALENGIKDIQKALDKKIEAFLKDFNSNINDLKSQGDLFGSLDVQIKAFDSSIDIFSEQFMEIRTKYNEKFTKIMKKLIKQNNGAVATYEKIMKENMVAFYNNYQHYLISNIERIKLIATEIITESPKITPFTLPEVDEIFEQVFTIFGEYLKKSHDENEKIIKKHKSKFLKSLNSIEKGVLTKTSQFQEHLKSLFEATQTEHANLMTNLGESYEAQFSEFEDRITQDLISLKNANQEIISKIMIKSAETSNKFFESAEENSRETRLIINSFLTQFNRMISDFNSSFNRMVDEIKDIIISKISKDSELLFNEHSTLPPSIVSEYDAGLENFQVMLDNFFQDHQEKLNSFKEDISKSIRSSVKKHLNAILKNVTESDEINKFINNSIKELDQNIKKYSEILDNSITTFKKIFKKLADKNPKLESIIDSM